MINKSILILLLFSILSCTNNDKSFDTVSINGNRWMTKNLNVSKFRNGEKIPQVKNNNQWQYYFKLHKPAWCYYNNDEKFGKYIGKIYNVYAILSYKGLAPEGFHIPNKKEILSLREGSGGSQNSGLYLKSQKFWSNYFGENSLFFNAFPVGLRNDNGCFGLLGEYGVWIGLEFDKLSNSVYNPTVVYYLNNHNNYFKVNDNTKNNYEYFNSGYIRCIED